MAREPFAEILGTKWTGAAFFWLLKGFKGKYNEQLIPKYDKRNLWTGYIINLLFFGALYYFFFVRERL
jgi:hypothetical protein